VKAPVSAVAEVAAAVVAVAEVVVTVMCVVLPVEWEVLLLMVVDLEADPAAAMVEVLVVCFLSTEIFEYSLMCKQASAAAAVVAAATAVAHTEVVEVDMAAVMAAAVVAATATPVVPAVHHHGGNPVTLDSIDDGVSQLLFRMEFFSFSVFPVLRHLHLERVPGRGGTMGSGQ
jgi:hypothetical protein